MIQSLLIFDPGRSGVVATRHTTQHLAAHSAPIRFVTRRTDPLS